MDGLPLVVIFIVLGLAIAGFFIAVAKRQIAAANAAFEGTANQLGLTFRAGTMSGGPTIAGTVDGFPAEVHSYTKKSGKSSSRYIRYTVEFPPLRIGLRLMRQKGIGRLFKVLGTQDLEIGDAEFDEAFIVQSAEPRAAREVLTPGRTMVLNRLLSVHPQLVVLDDRLVIDRQGIVTDSDDLTSTLRRLASAAEVLADAGVAREMTDAVQRRIDGTPPVASAAAHHDAGVDVRIAVGEELAAAGVDGLAGKIFAALAAELPADPEITGWAERTQRVADEPPPSVVEEPLPPVVDEPDPEFVDLDVTVPVYTPDLEAEAMLTEPVPEPDASADVREMVDEDPVAMATDLFGEHNLSFQTAARYDEAFAGRRVRWSGKLRRIRTVDEDRILGVGPFDKAVVDIATLENDLFGNTVVSAVVAFPPGTAEAISPGTDITFTGRLTGIDALVRNLFVDDAALAPRP